jgi:hypothetical protein
METRQNMRNTLKMAGLAALMALGAGLAAAPATAQGLDIRVGPDRGPRVMERRVYREERVRPRRSVCTTRWRDGRRVEVCRSEGRGPRF